MAEKEKKLSPEDQKALEAAEATIRRIRGDVPPVNPEQPTVLRKWRVLLHGVTWDEKTKKLFDNTCKGQVVDRSNGQKKEITMDRAIVMAYTAAHAMQEFMKAWGITSSDHIGTMKALEVRDLTEDERLNPPANVIAPVPNILVGVPAPKILPIRADGEFNRPVVPPNVAVG